MEKENVSTEAVQEMSAQKFALIELAFIIGVAGGLNIMLLVDELCSRYGLTGTDYEKRLMRTASNVSQLCDYYFSYFVADFFGNVVREIKKTYSEPKFRNMPICRVKEATAYLTGLIEVGFNVPGGLCIDGMSVEDDDAIHGPDQLPF